MIELRQLSIGFPRAGREPVLAVRDLTLSVAQGERVGIVGESGSGKSLTALACLGLVPEPGHIINGAILIEGRDLERVNTTDLQQWRGRTVGIVFQEASSALNPVYTVGFQLEETVRTHRSINRDERRDRVRELLLMVSIDQVEQILASYPHQLSGGQVQRVMLAIALAGDPRLLIADEPTSSLDLITRAEILQLLDRLVEDGGMGLLLISHDLGVVRNMVDRVAVMYAGEIVEEAPTDVLFSDPLHPYTRMLLANQALIGAYRRQSVLDLGPRGCSFAPRCLIAQPSCRRCRPELMRLDFDRKLRCPVTADPSEIDHAEQ